MLTASPVCISRLHHPPELFLVDILEQGSLQGLRNFAALCTSEICTLLLKTALGRRRALPPEEGGSCLKQAALPAGF
jgi:hypothetical protein